MHGASGFLLEDAPPEHLVSAMRTVVSGEGLLAPATTRRVLDEFARRPPASLQMRDRVQAVLFTYEHHRLVEPGLR